METASGLETSCFVENTESGDGHIRINASFPAGGKSMIRIEDESRCAAGDSLLTLHSLNAVDPRGPLLAPDDPVGGREEHVLGAAHRHPVHGELVCVGIPAQ